MDERRNRKKQIEMKQKSGRKKINSAKKKRKNNIKRVRNPEKSSVNQNSKPQEFSEKPKKFVSKKRIKRRNRIISVVLLIIMIVGVMTALSLTVFFPIKTIKISGSEKYSAKEISSAIGVVKGDNLLLASEKRANTAVKSTYPYIKEIKFIKSLPFTLNVKVSEYDVFAQIKYSSGYIRIGKDGKVLEIADKYLKGAAVITGVTVTEKTIGETVAFESKDGEEDIFQKTNEIINAFENSKIGGVTLINFNNMQDIRVTYNNQIVMLIGSSANLDKKLAHAKATLEARSESKETGTLNLSRIPSAKNEASFIPRELQKDEIAGKKK